MIRFIGYLKSHIELIGPLSLVPFHIIFRYCVCSDLKMDVILVQVGYVGFKLDHRTIGYWRKKLSVINMY